MKIGTAPWMIEASPESMRVSPQERSQNGSAVFTSPTTTSQRHAPRGAVMRHLGAELNERAIAAARSTKAEARRPRMRVMPSTARAADPIVTILISMKGDDAPQMSASTHKEDGRPTHFYVVERNAPGVP